MNIQLNSSYVETLLVVVSKITFPEQKRLYVVIVIIIYILPL